MSVLVVGTGPVGIEYARILTDMGVSVKVVGRSQAGCDAFKFKTGIEALSGGVEQIEKLAQLPDHAIVAASEAQLGNVTSYLINKGIKRILIEKPGATTTQDIRDLSALSKLYNAEVYVGYNRRFHAATLEAQKIIAEDGGVKSFNFEFTEWTHINDGIVKEPGIKEKWFLHNSTHVIDMAFNFGGWPVQLHPVSSGGLSWHPHSRYAGAGVSDSGAVFSYFADWQGPGRWSVEILTLKHRLIFRPLEKLAIQKIGELTMKVAEIDDSLDIKYKPGFYRQTEIFLSNPAALLSLQEQARNCDVYDRINPQL